MDAARGNRIVRVQVRPIQYCNKESTRTRQVWKVWAAGQPVDSSRDPEPKLRLYPTLVGEFWWSVTNHQLDACLIKPLLLFVPPALLPASTSVSLLTNAKIKTSQHLVDSKNLRDRSCCLGLSDVTDGRSVRGKGDVIFA